VAEQQQKSAKDLPPIAVSSSSQGKSLAKLLYLNQMATLQQYIEDRCCCIRNTLQTLPKGGKITISFLWSCCWEMGGGLDPIISGVMPKGNSILFTKWEGFKNFVLPSLTAPYSLFTNNSLPII
jgi:hypothetical protein